MEIDINLIKKLREETSCGVMDSAVGCTSIGV